MDKSNKRIYMTKLKNMIIIVLFSCVLIVSLTALLFSETKAVSDAERRPFAQFPQVSYENVISGEVFEAFEEYALDQFVFRDFFRTVKALGSYYLLGKLDNNDYYSYNGALYKIERLNESSVLSFGRKIQTIAEKYQNLSAYYAVIPDKNSLIYNESGRVGMDLNRVEQLIVQTVTAAERIDIASMLSISDYYSTDLHICLDSLL